MTKTVKKHIAFWAAFAMVMAMLMYFPSGTFNIDWNLTASAAEGDVLINATNFPDEIFRNYVQGFDTVDDDILSAEEIAAVTSISVNNKGISDLKGIEYFTELEYLNCYINNLTSLDVSQNTALTELYCSFNSLTSLDVSKNTALKTLSCVRNDLTSLDVSKNTALRTMDCGNNQLTSLDVSQNTALTELYCNNNQLTSLDVSQNTALTVLNCYGNQLTSLDVSGCAALTELYCNYNYLTSLDVSKNTALIKLDCSKNPLIALNEASIISNFNASSLSAFTAKSPVIRLADYGINADKVSGLNGGTIENGYLLVDGTATYTYDIDGNLGDNTISCTINAGGIAINDTNFPDANFRDYVKSFDTDKNNTLSGTEIAAVTEIDVSFRGISDLKGIEYFTALKTLSCYSNQLTSLDVSKNTALTYLKCNGNNFESLDVSKNTALTFLNCADNSLTSLDVSKNTALTELYCQSNQLTSLDVSQNTALLKLGCGGNQLTSLDISQNTALTELKCADKSLTTLDVSQNTALTRLYCSNNDLTSLDVSKCTALVWLYCNYNKLTSLDVSQNTALTQLECDRNKLTSLDVSKNTELFFLNCSVNPLIAVNAASSIWSFDASSLSAFTAKSPVIRLADYGIKEDMISDLMGGTIENGYLVVDGTATYTYDIDGDLGGNSISCTINASGIAINEENFPNETFRNYVKSFDTVDNNNILSGTEIAAVTSIDVSDKGISDLKGIEYFTALKTLSCYSNQLTSLDVSKNTALTELYCYSNKLTSLDVSKNTALTSLNCSSNQLTSLDVSQNTALKYLYCNNNKLTSLDVSKNTALKNLYCGSNQLTSLDVRQNTALTVLSCRSNTLESLDVSNNTELTALSCYDNKLTSLDLSKNTALITLSCENNSLTSLDVSRCIALGYLYCYDNKLTSLDVSNNTELIELYCYNNQFTSLDVSHNTALEYLNCESNQLTSLDVSHNTALTELYCDGNKYQIKLTGSTFDVTKLPEGFDITKASEWTNAKVQGNILIVTDPTQAVTYKYALGNNSTEIFTLVPVSAELTEDMISEIKAQTYTGSEIKPEITVSCGGKVLTEGEDYTVSYEDNIDAGNAKVIVTAKGDFYTGKAYREFKINPLDIKNAVITLAEPKLVYNGEAQTQEIESVKVNGLTLTADDYTISDNTETNAGTHTLTIKGKGNFTGTATADFEISPLDIKNAVITLAEPKLVYNGEAQTQEIESVKINDLTLTAEDYTISGSKGTNADSYTLTITGVGNFTGTATADFEISPLDIKNAEITLAEPKLVYNGEAQTQAIESVKVNGLTLTADDYTISDNNGTNADSYTLTITGKGNFTGTATADFEISPLDIEDAVITLAEPKLVYNGEAQTQAIESVKINDLILKADDYTISGNTGTNADSYTLTIAGKGNFTGTATADFEINPLDIEDAEITLAEPKLVYNGEAQTQAIESVKINDLILKADDYTISGNTGTNADSYTLTIAGKGNFTGTATADFEINPLDIEDAEITLAEPKLVYNGEAQTQAIESVKINDLILKADDYTISDNNGTNADTYTLTIMGVGNFTGEATAEFVIGKAEPSVTPIVEDTEFYVGDALPEIDCESAISGIINWVTELAEGLAEGENNLEWMFTPDDTDNYEIVTGTMAVNAQTTTTTTTTTAETTNTATESESTTIMPVTTAATTTSVTKSTTTITDVTSVATIPVTTTEVTTSVTKSTTTITDVTSVATIPVTTTEVTTTVTESTTTITDVTSATESVATIPVTTTEITTSVTNPTTTITDVTSATESVATIPVTTTEITTSVTNPTTTITYVTSATESVATIPVTTTEITTSVTNPTTAITDATSATESVATIPVTTTEVTTSVTNPTTAITDATSATESTATTEVTTTVTESTTTTTDVTSATESTATTEVTTTVTESTTTTTNITSATESTTATSAVTTTTTGNTEYFASLEEMCEMAINDYEQKYGVLPENAQAIINDDGTVSIKMTDESGNVLDTYTIDPATGIGTGENGEEVNLPQTGNNSMSSLMMVTGAALLACVGFFAIVKSGVIGRKKKDE